MTLSKSISAKVRGQLEAHKDCHESRPGDMAIAQITCVACSIVATYLVSQSLDKSEHSYADFLDKVAQSLVILLEPQHVA